MTLANKVAQFNADADKVNRITHGDDSTIVQTESGPVRSLAKLIKDNDAAINGSGLLGQVRAHTVAASVAQAAAENAKMLAEVAAVAAQAIQAVGGAIGKTTLALLSADLDHAADSLAIVTNDPTPANNATYIKVGAPGTGMWQPASADRITALAAVLESRISSSLFDLIEFAICDRDGFAALLIEKGGLVRIPKLAGNEIAVERMDFPTSYLEETNAIGYQYAITDKFGAVVLGILDNGDVSLPGLNLGEMDIAVESAIGYQYAITDKFGAVVLGILDNGDVSLPRLNMGEMDIAVEPVIGYQYVITDKLGAIAFGITDNGEVVFGHGIRSQPTLQWNTLTLGNADTIAHIGDSYTASHYALKDKAYISIISALSPYRHQNFGISGNDSLDMNYRIVNDSVYFDGKKFSDMRPRYALLASYTNDAQFWLAGTNYARENLCRLVDTVRAVGTEPIICTEFPQTATDRGVHRAVAAQYGLRYVDSSPFTAELGHLPVGPFMQGHPGTRNNGIFWIDMLREVDALPRPDKGIKIFRRRSGFVPATVDDLLYKTRVDRMAKWKELSLTHYRLSDNAQQYYDELNGPNVYDFSLVTDEYWALQKKQPVRFADYGLIEVTLPGTAVTLDEVKITLGLTAPATVFIRNYLDVSASLPGLVQGASPTLPEYLAKWNRPRGAWISLGAYAGVISLSSALRGAMEGDVLTILVHNAGGFDLTDINVDYRGPLGKALRPPAPPRLLATGPELLGKTTCANPADLAAWTVHGSPVTLVPVDQTSAPRQPANSAQPIAGVCVLSSADTIGQTVTVSPGTSGKRLRLSVWVRHFPKAFLTNSGPGSYNADPAQVIDRAASGVTFADSEITADTFDLRTIRLEWCFGAAIPATGGVQVDEFACLSWRAVEFDIDVPPEPQASAIFTFRLSCPDGQIQVAKASFKECN